MSRLDEIRARKREKVSDRKVQSLIPQETETEEESPFSPQELSPRELFDVETGPVSPPDDHVNGFAGSGMSRPVAMDETMSLVTEEKQESDTAKAIIAIMGDADLRKQSELSKEEVRALTVLSEICDKFNSPRMRTLLENWLAHMVSHDRGSRREVVQAFSGLEEHGRARHGGMYAPPGTMPLRIQ